MTPQKHKPKRIQLLPGDRLLAVVPEYVAGPGWANAVAWVYIATADGKLRLDDLQPHERSPALAILFPHGAQLCAALLAAVPTHLVKEQ